MVKEVLVFFGFLCDVLIRECLILIKKGLSAYGRIEKIYLDRV